MRIFYRSLAGYILRTELPIPLIIWLNGCAIRSFADMPDFSHELSMISIAFVLSPYIVSADGLWRRKAKFFSRFAVFRASVDHIHINEWNKISFLKASHTARSFDDFTSRKTRLWPSSISSFYLLQRMEHDQPVFRILTGSRNAFNPLT